MDQTNCERGGWEGEVRLRLCVWLYEYFKENANGKEYLSPILLIHNFCVGLITYYKNKIQSNLLLYFYKKDKFVHQLY